MRTDSNLRAHRKADPLGAGRITLRTSTADDTQAMRVMRALLTLVVLAAGSVLGLGLVRGMVEVANQRAAVLHHVAVSEVRGK